MSTTERTWKSGEGMPEDGKDHPLHAPPRAPKEKKRKPMPRKRKMVLAGVVLLLLVAAGYFGYQRYTYESTDDAQVRAHFTLLAPKVAGVVNQVLVNEHDHVKAGQVLVVLEDKDYRAALANAEATLGSRATAYQTARTDFERAQKLVRSHAITRQAYDHAEGAFREAQRVMKAAQATVDQARLDLEYTRVRAPTDGVIGRKSVEIGMYAGSGTALMGFVQNDDRWVMANYKETQLSSIVPGKAVKISVDAIDDKDFEGYVESISPSTGATFTLFPPDNATGNFTKVVQRVPVKIRFKNLKPEDIDRLQSGLSAVVDVIKHSTPGPVPKIPVPAYFSQTSQTLPEIPPTGTESAGTARTDTPRTGTAILRSGSVPPRGEQSSGARPDGMRSHGSESAGSESDEAQSAGEARESQPAR